MARTKKNADGVIEPVSRKPSPAEMLPTAAEQRPKEEENNTPREGKSAEKSKNHQF